MLGPIRRFAFENDAADEDLPADHWFWDPRRSGGIFIEHGVHFFDLAADLIGSPVEAIQAMASTRADGRTDTVCATARYHSGATASWYHSFTHARRGERQSLRLDLGNGECRLDGWIPLDLQLEAWTDRAGMEALRAAATDTSELGVPERQVSVTAAPAPEHATGATSRGNPPRTHPTRPRRRTPSRPSTPPASATSSPTSSPPSTTADHPASTSTPPPRPSPWQPPQPRRPGLAARCN